MQISIKKPQKSKGALIVAILLIAAVTAFAAAIPELALAQGAKDQVCAGIGGCDQAAETGISNILKTVINIMSALVGAIAVIMIVIGGFRYITSAGDANRVGGAKNTIIYALVGLVIVALAQVIVHFVLENAT